MFSGAKVKLKTKIYLTDQSHFFGWDICCLGRPASGENFTQGTFDQRFEIWFKDKPMHLERLLVQENDPILYTKWGLLGRPVVGNLVCFTSKGELINLLRQHFPRIGSGYFFSITFVNGVILCRYLGNSVEQAKRLFIKAWQILRFALLGYPATIPRIWNT